MRRFSRRYFLILFLIVLAIVGGYFYKNKISYKNPELAAELEAKELAEKVGKLILLPKDEVPTIATVSDPEVLKNQAFFKDAKRGDKVLIFTNAKKAILYDPSANLIINVAPVNLGSFQASPIAPSESGIFTPNEF